MSSHADPQIGLKASLARLNITHLDLYLMHFPFGMAKGKAEFDHVEVYVCVGFMRKR